MCIRDRVSVDGDTSTNDTIAVLANGMAENPESLAGTAEYETFRTGLKTICERLSRMLAKDGEGATKLLVCKVSGGKTKEDARKVAKGCLLYTSFRSSPGICRGCGSGRIRKGCGRASGKRGSAAGGFPVCIERLQFSSK